MKKLNRVIIVSIVICFLITLICLLLLKKNNKGENVKDLVIDNSQYYKVEQVKNIQKTYNIEQIINDIIEEYNDFITYDGYSKLNYIMPEEYIQSMNDIGIDKNLKVFCIQDLYEADIENDTTVFFAEGYLMYEDINEIHDNTISKQDVKLTIYKSNSSNQYAIEPYGNNDLSYFDYNENIAETGIKYDTPSDLAEWLMDEIQFFKNDTLEKKVSESDIITWCYKDYKNKKLFEEQNKEEYEKTKIISFTGSKENGYNVKINNGTELIIKLGDKLMDYEITAK